MSSDVDRGQEPSGRQLAAGSSPKVQPLWVSAYVHVPLAHTSTLDFMHSTYNTIGLLWKIQKQKHVFKGIITNIFI